MATAQKTVIDDMFHDLNSSQYQQLLERTSDYADGLAVTVGSSEFKPAYYPAARVMQAFALAGLQRYAVARKVAATEIDRITLIEKHQTDIANVPDLEAVMAFHVGLDVHVVNEQEGLVSAIANYERLVDRIAANNGDGQEGILYVRGIFNKIMERHLGSGLSVDLAEMNFQELLGKLNRARNQLATRVNNDFVKVYEMPPLSGYNFGCGFDSQGFDDFAILTR